MTVGINYNIKLLRKRLMFQKIMTLLICTVKKLRRLVEMDSESICPRREESHSGLG